MLSGKPLCAAQWQIYYQTTQRNIEAYRAKPLLGVGAQPAPAKLSY